MSTVCSFTILLDDDDDDSLYLLVDVILITLPTIIVCNIIFVDLQVNFEIIMF